MLYNSEMFIKFKDDSSQFEEAVKIFKRRYHTTAAATAVRQAALEYSQYAFEVENLREVIKLKDERIKHLERQIEHLMGYKF